MLQTINYAITKIFDVILYPFGFINDFWGLLFLSIIVSFVVLIIFKYVSSPRKIKNAKNKIKSSILAIRLYKDFWRVIAGSFFKSLGYTFKYFFLNFGPILLIIPLLAPIFFQMDARYGMRPFKKDEIFVVKAKFNSNVFDLNIKMLKNKNFVPVMNPVFINAFEDDEKTIPIREVNWKLKTVTAGTTNIQIQVNDKILEKKLIIGRNKNALSNKKFRRSSLEHFLYPVEALLNGSKYLDSLNIHYPSRTISFMGIKAHWLVYHLILVVIIVLALRKKFGVEF